MFTLIVGSFACCPAPSRRDVPTATAMRIKVGAADSGAVPRQRTRTLDLEETPTHHRHGIVACGEPRSRWSGPMATLPVPERAAPSWRSSLLYEIPVGRQGRPGNEQSLHTDPHQQGEARPPA